MLCCYCCCYWCDDDVDNNNDVKRFLFFFANGGCQHWFSDIPELACKRWCGGGGSGGCAATSVNKVLLPRVAAAIHLVAVAGRAKKYSIQLIGFASFPGLFLSEQNAFKWFKKRSTAKHRHFFRFLVHWNGTMITVEVLGERLQNRRFAVTDMAQLKSCCLVIPNAGANQNLIACASNWAGNRVSNWLISL